MKETNRIKKDSNESLLCTDSGTLCNQESCYDTMTISSFIDGEISPEESEEVKNHLDNCPVCRQVVDHYLSFEKALNSGIASSFKDQDVKILQNRIMATHDLYAKKGADLNGIQNKIRSKLHSIKDFASSSIFSLPKIYLQIASLAAIIILSITALRDITDVNAPMQSVMAQSSPSAIVTSVNGDISSVIILETEDTHHTIIWYQEV
ncbi:hypothetical protein MTBBW1_1260017 [Desulfamplus magnetovallimortis]|uniref:Putative zinc-finger domain-containing protein n=1 Tax=Desulfamplus magnetovallimortis TaxID=1246637 RepID=A0A1W1H6U0_9BACT|nr:anti-sigma factor [Desulfamplus magnetovallimortis]SLM28095.1 hypothetical protein MTBBW1_1260017 [Desulfamplus magnetovallimortis]